MQKLFVANSIFKTPKIKPRLLDAAIIYKDHYFVVIEIKRHALRTLPREPGPRSDLALDTVRVSGGRSI